jgi:hypothetical protein
LQSGEKRKTEVKRSHIQLNTYTKQLENLHKTSEKLFEDVKQINRIVSERKANYERQATDAENIFSQNIDMMLTNKEGTKILEKRKHFNLFQN